MALDYPDQYCREDRRASKSRVRKACNWIRGHVKEENYTFGHKTLLERYEWIVQPSPKSTHKFLRNR